MPVPPKQVEADTNQIMNAWGELAPDKTFAGMTLAQYKAKVKPSFDARTTITSLETQMTAALDARADADKVTLDLNQKVVKSVAGDVEFGEDSDLYEAMGYVRKSARKTGLTRKKTPPPPAK